ncbi:unnamed protein product [Enterobius vermicularis]|uniref:Integrator complex subunit 7 n=1 Tax=Enterobius vermicularis TaxID=51028 RepID=A0A0N4V7I5_ENTVE|nr:unnamed protein product [Enterobius vermicularis]
MGDTSLKQQLALQAIDKGLQTRLLHEQMATIVKLPTYFRENPFSLFINTILIRMAEAFRDGSNDLRLCLVRVMGECAEELKLVFSNEEIARRILKVSHSTDSVARSLTLQMLAQTFSKTIFEKLCVLLTSPSVPPARKILLCEVFASMRTDIDLTMRIFALGEIILNSTCNQRLMFSLFTSLTTLVCSSKVAAAELSVRNKVLWICLFFNLIFCYAKLTFHLAFQLAMLIERMKMSLKNSALCTVILNNIKRLSSAAHMLSENEVRSLCEFNGSITDDQVLCAWLAVIVRFSIQGVHKINQIFNALCPCFSKETFETLLEFAARWKVLLTSQSVACKLYAFQLFVNLYFLLRSPDLSLLLFSSFTAHLKDKTSSGSEKFYRIMTAFVRVDACPLELVNALVEQVINESSGSTTFVNIIRFLVAVAEIHPHLYGRLAHWSAEKLSRGVDYSNLTMFALLVYAPFENLTSLKEDHIDCWGPHPWTRYLVARAAMRNGHFKKVALPLLQSIRHHFGRRALLEVKFKSFDAALWISALVDFCSASLDSFTLDAIEASLCSYNRSLISLKALCSCYESRHYFSFARGYTEYLALMLSVFRDVVLIVNTVIMLSSDPMPAHVRSRVSLRFNELHLRMVSCRVSFCNLYSSCFDADGNTLTLIDMYAAMCSTVDSALLLYSQKNYAPAPEIAKGQNTSFITERFRKTLLWARNQIERLAQVDFEERISQQHALNMMEIFERLTCLQIGVPRFFFQQFKDTHVKLNISPQPTSNDLSVIAMSSQQLPVTVEGVIEGTDTSAIRKVLVTATVKFQKNIHKDYSHVVFAELKDEKFFKVQFLQTFLQNCTISFSVDFMDKETKRLWKTDAKADLSISV